MGYFGASDDERAERRAAREERLDEYRASDAYKARWADSIDNPAAPFMDKSPEEIQSLIIHMAQLLRVSGKVTKGGGLGREQFLETLGELEAAKETKRRELLQESEQQRRELLQEIEEDMVYFQPQGEGDIAVEEDPKPTRGSSRTTATPEKLEHLPPSQFDKVERRIEVTKPEPTNKNQPSGSKKRDTKGDNLHLLVDGPTLTESPAEKAASEARRKKVIAELEAVMDEAKKAEPKAKKAPSRTTNPNTLRR